MYFDRDEVEIKRQKERLFREGLEASLREKQQRNNNVGDRESGGGFFMQQSIKKQEEQVHKKDKFIKELKQQYQKDMEMKKLAKIEAKRKDMELDEKIRREAEELAKKQREEIERQKMKKGYKPPNTEIKAEEKVRVPSITPTISFEKQLAIENFSQPQIIRPLSFSIQQEPTIRYRPILTDDFRRAKLNLEEEAYRMAQLKQKIQSSTRDNNPNREGKSQGLTELQNLNRLLQQKQQNYYKLPSQILDSLDVEVANHRRKSNPSQPDLRSYYEFKL